MTRCMRPARPSKKASCLAAAWRSFAPPRRSSACARTTRTRSMASRSCVRRSRLRHARSPSIPARTVRLSSARSLEKDQYAFGFDAQDLEYGDLVKKGIIDPTKVVRQALQGASSIAGLLITTEAMVAELPKKETPAPAMPGGMGGMDY